MKRMLMMLALLLLASPMIFAQTPLYPTAGGHWVPIAAGIGMAIASGLCGLGQGKAVAGAAEGIARNPSAAGGRARRAVQKRRPTSPRVPRGPVPADLPSPPLRSG